MKIWIILSLIMFSLGTSLASHGASFDEIIAQSSETPHQYPGQDEKSENTELFDMELEEDCIFQSELSGFEIWSATPHFPDHLRPYLAYLDPEDRPPKS